MTEHPIPLCAEIDRLQEKVKELEDWKASAAEVERSWDAQKVGEEAELTSLKSNLPKSALDLEKENERLKAELTEAHSFLARQQYADLQLLGKRDEKIRHLENELAEAREALNTIAHGNDYESSTRAIDALKNENVKLRDALDTIEGMATDTTYDIQGIAKAALKANEHIILKN